MGHLDDLPSGPLQNRYWLSGEYARNPVVTVVAVILAVLIIPVPLVYGLLVALGIA